MAEPDWAIVLHGLHQEAPHRIRKEVDEKHVLVQNTNLSPRTVDNSLQSLHDWGLVEEAPVRIRIANGVKETSDRMESDIQGYQLSTKGFEVAHDRRQAETNHRINRSLVLFTLFLVLVEVFNLVPLPSWGRIVAALFLLGGMYYAVREGFVKF